MPDQPEVLEDNADAPAIWRQGFPRRVGQLVAEQLDAPARRPLCKIEELQERRFARARWAGEEIEAAGGQPEVQVTEHFRAGPVAKAYPVEFDDRCQLPQPLTRALRSKAFLAQACPPCQWRQHAVYQMNSPNRGVFGPR